MKNMKIAGICLAIASFAGIDASWSAFTSQTSAKNGVQTQLHEIYMTSDDKKPIDTNIYPTDLNARWNTQQTRQYEYYYPLWLEKRQLDQLNRRYDQHLKMLSNPNNQIAIDSHAFEHEKICLKRWSLARKIETHDDMTKHRNSTIFKYTVTLMSMFIAYISYK